MQEPVYFDVVGKFRQQWVQDTYNVELTSSHHNNDKIFENWANYAISKINCDLDLSIDENVVEFRRLIAQVFADGYSGKIEWFPHAEHMIAVRLSFPNREALAVFVLQWTP